jgi:hypothetical protein
VDGKREYLDRLEREGLLPNASHTLGATRRDEAGTATAVMTRSSPSARPSQRSTLIPHTDYGILWLGRLQRHHAIWEELQFRLELARHPNAISVLFRVLIELSIENCVTQQGISVHDGDKLAARALKVAKHLHGLGKIDQKQLGVVNKFQQLDQLVSADTLNRYVHSPNFAPSPEHLVSLWDTLANFVVSCLKA